MSNVKIIAEHGTAICIAGLGLAGTTTVPTLAIGAAVLGAVGVEMFKNNRKTCEKAAKRVMRDMETSGALDPEVLARARDLLQGKTEVTVAHRPARGGEASGFLQRRHRPPDAELSRGCRPGCNQPDPHGDGQRLYRLPS